MRDAREADPGPSHLPELTVIGTNVGPTRATGHVIDDMIALLNPQPVAWIPDPTAVEPEECRAPIAIAAPDSPLALAYEQLVERLAGWAVVA